MVKKVSSPFSGFSNGILFDCMRGRRKGEKESDVSDVIEEIEKISEAIEDFKKTEDSDIGGKISGAIKDIGEKV